MFLVGESPTLSKTLKNSTSLNAFKHNIKKHYINELKKKVLIIVSVFFDVSKISIFIRI